jgi:hypothetical protein
MSGAIIAKSINDSIGTPDFKGLNSIIDEQLTRFNRNLNDTLVDFVERLKTQQAKGLRASDKIYWVFNNGFARVQGSAWKQIGETLVINYDGSIAISAKIEVDGRARVVAQAQLNGTPITILDKSNPDYSKIEIEGSETIKVKAGDVLKVGGYAFSMDSTDQLGASSFNFRILAETMDISGIIVE